MHLRFACYRNPVPHPRTDVYSLVVLAPLPASAEPRSIWLSPGEDEVAEALALRLRLLPGGAEALASHRRVPGFGLGCGSALGSGRRQVP